MDNLLKSLKANPRFLPMWILFFAYLAIRLVLASKSGYYSDDTSYFHQRQIEHIAENWKPLLSDDLSYSGRTFAFLPLYHYILALPVALFGPFAAKIVSNILASLVVLAAYLAVMRLTGSRLSSFVSSTVIAFSPIYLISTLNRLTPSAALLPAGLFLLYLLLDLKEGNMPIVLFLTITVSLLSSNAIYLLFGYTIYILINFVESRPAQRLEQEYVSFFLLFFTWVNFLFFKTAFQMHGFAVMWGNTPPPVLQEYFLSFNFIYAIIGLGVLPLIFGLYTAYKCLFVRYVREIMLISSMVISSLIILWGKLSVLEEALLFVSIFLALLFGASIKEMSGFLKKTKLSEKSTMIMAGLVLAVMLLNVIPGIAAALEDRVSKEEYFMEFMQISFLPEDAAVMSLPENGNLITYFGKRQNIIDTQYLLVDSEQRFEDVRRVFRTKFVLDALQVIKKYGATHILVHGENNIFREDPCFSQVSGEFIIVYEVVEDCRH
jgi:hypothetical protein